MVKADCHFTPRGMLPEYLGTLPQKPVEVSLDESEDDADSGGAQNDASSPGNEYSAKRRRHKYLP